MRNILTIWQEARRDDAEKVILGHGMRVFLHAYPQIQGIHWLVQNRGKGHMSRFVLERLLWKWYPRGHWRGKDKFKGKDCFTQLRSI